MSRVLSDKPSSEFHKPKDIHVCRIPRRTPAKSFRAIANFSRPPLSHQDAPHTTAFTMNPKLYGLPASKAPIRSRSQDVRARRNESPASLSQKRQDRPNTGIMTKMKSDLAKKFAETLAQSRPYIKTDDDTGKFKHNSNASTKSSPAAVPLELRSNSSRPDTDSMTTPITTGTIKELQSALKDKRVHFERLKSELADKQKNVCDVFADLKVTQRRIEMFGGDSMCAELPTLDDVPLAYAVPSPTALGGAGLQGGTEEGSSQSAHVPEVLTRLPPGLISCCDNSVRNQKEIILWLGALMKSRDKGIRKQDLSNKILEFSRSYKVVSAAVEEAKLQFMKEITDVGELIRMGGDERDRLRRETERLCIMVAELQTQNTDLHKQLISPEHPKYIRSDKAKIEEMERELKEEKCKKAIVRDRLTRSDAALKTATTKICELEEMLQKMNAEKNTLENSVLHLQEQNLKIQVRYDEEFNNLSDSLKSTASQASEMEKIRVKLVEEKKELERRLEESEYEYSVTTAHIKKELNDAVSKLSDIEEQKNNIAEERNKLKSELEVALDKIKQEQETSMKLLHKLKKHEHEIEQTDSIRKEMNEKSDSISYLENKIAVLTQKLREYKDKNNELLVNNKHHQEMKDSLAEELLKKEKCIMEIKNELMAELRSKTDCIADLKKKMVELEDTLQESELKVEVHENQLQSLKTSIGYTLQDEENSSESFAKIRKLVCEQREKYQEMSQNHTKLVDELQRKDEDIQEHKNTINVLRTELARAQEFAKSLSEKEDELENTIAILQNELQLSNGKESKLSRKLFERSEEVQILLTNLEKRKLEIRQLEEIILTLEGQSCKMRASRKSLENKIKELENKLQHKKKQKVSVPEEYIDNFISILEAELGDLDCDELRTGDSESSNSLMSKKKRLESLSPNIREKRYCGDSDLNTLNRCLENYKIFKVSSSIGIEQNVPESNYLSDDSVTSRNRELKKYLSVGATHSIYHALHNDIELQPPLKTCDASSPVRSVRANAAAVSGTSTETNQAGRKGPGSPHERLFQYDNSELI